MKKVFAIIAALCLVFSMTVVAMAGENGGSIYLDYSVGGSANLISKSTGNPDTTTDYNTSGFVVGGGYTFGNIIIGLDYASISLKEKNNDSNKDIDFAMFKIKGGYQIVNNEMFKVNLGGGYSNETLSNKTSGGDPLIINGLSIGGDVNYAITEKIGVSLGVDFGVFMNWTNKQLDTYIDAFKALGATASKTASATMISLKGSYMVTDSMGVTLGYTSLATTFGAKLEMGGATSSMQNDQNLSLFTVGGIFKF